MGGVNDSMAGAVSIEGVPPLTVKNEALWSADLMEGAPVHVTSLGVLTFSAEKSVEGKSYAPVLLSPEDGSERWVGKAIQSGAMPRLDWVQQGQDRWAVSTVSRGTKTSVYAWNGLASNTEASLTSSATFEGAETAPRVTFSGSGVLVTGAESPSAGPMIYWPKDGSTTLYKDGPKRDGEAGVPVAAYGEGFLVTFPKGGFSMASATGGWASSSVAPKGAAPQSGTVLAQKDGYIVSEWTPAEKAGETLPILAVHSAATGQLFAQHTTATSDKPTLEEQKAKGAELVTDTPNWVAWGQIGFDLDKGGAGFYQLEGGTPTAIIDDLLYVRSAFTLLPQATGATPSPSRKPTPSASAAASAVLSSASATPSASATVDPEAPDGFRGVTGVDLLTRQPLAGLPSIYPIGRTSTGQVILRDDAKPSVYSVAIR